jgi:hypothetical protein
MPDGKPAPVRKLARMLYTQHPLSFKDEEEARAKIRLVVGKRGNYHRIEASDKSLFRAEPGSMNPYNIPKSDETVWEPYILDGSRILGLFDIHCPYHSVSALSAAFEWGRKMKPDTILIGGDGIDSHQLSRFMKDPKKRDFAGELAVFQELIGSIRKAFPKAKIVYKVGNHEERYDAFLYQKAGELSGIEEFSLESIIRKRAGDIEFVTDKRIIKAGDLNIIHGHEFVQGIFNPVNVARGLFLRAKVSAMQGHSHQTSEHTETDMNGRITTTWSVGCLSELHPAYMPLNKWNHGFAFVEVDKSGDFQVHNKRIHKGEVL